MFLRFRYEASVQRYLIFFFLISNLYAESLPIFSASQWEKNNSHSALKINHQPLQNFINRYVYTTSKNFYFVHYSKVTEEDKEKLAEYIQYLSTIPIENYQRNEQLAFWINLYNALTIQTVLQHFPVKSIKNINLNPHWLMRFIYPGPWDAPLVTVDGIRLSLNDIEHRIVRKAWRDPRTHYALNCASLSCPKLFTAYTGKNLDAQLNKAAKDYINSSQGVSIEKNKLIVSRIYQWYSDDFGGNDESILNHLKYYAKPDLKKELNRFTHIDDYKYDWSLNGD